MKKIKLIIAIIIIIAGFGAVINSSYMSGLLLLVLGVTLLPVLSAEISGRIPLWNKKPVRYGFYIILFLLSAGLANKNKLPKSKKVDSIKSNSLVKSNTLVDENNQIELTKDLKFNTCDFGGEKSFIIPDMIAADIYPNFENKGFKINKQIRNENTSIYCELSTSKEKLNVIITGCSPEEIICVEATAIDYSGENQKDVEDFLAYVATLQYKNSDPKTAKKWVKKNIDKNGAKTTIGGVTFSINFKTIKSKFLRMEINNFEKISDIKQIMDSDNSEFWGKFDPIVKVRVYKMIEEKDCFGLQNEFNTTADNMDKLQSAGKSASRNIDLMNFLEEQMKEFDCH